MGERVDGCKQVGGPGHGPLKQTTLNGESDSGRGVREMAMEEVDYSERVKRDYYNRDTERDADRQKQRFGRTEEGDRVL